MIYIRPSVRADIVELALNMRKEERDEVKAVSGHSPYAAVKKGFENSYFRFSVLKKSPTRDDMIFMCGISPCTALISKQAFVWMLTSNAVYDCNVREFLKITQRIRDEFLSVYPILCNFVDSRHKKSIKWLQWLGAQIYEAKPFGSEQKLFNYFELRRK
jgi:hypothetical protein